MATPVGTDELTSLSRRFIIPRIQEIVYNSNLMFHRLSQSRTMRIAGGYQIEMPLVVKKFTIGGSANLGYDPIPNTPQDTIVSAAWDWKQVALGISIDKLTLIKADSPDKVFHLLKTKFEQGEMHMGDIMGTQIHSDGTTSTDVEGYELAIDDGGVAASYAAVNRSTYSGWAANDDSSTATQTIAAMRDVFFDCKIGGNAPTLIESRDDQYVRYLALGDSEQRFPVGASGHDEQLLSFGFTNAYFMGVPWATDSHQFDGPDANNSAVTFHNERHQRLGVSPMAEFTCTPFQASQNGKVYVSNMDWAGNLIVENPRTMGKMTALTA